jgi:hypothetical protein
MRVPLPGERALVLVVRKREDEEKLAEIIHLGVQQKFKGQTAWVRHGLEREGWDIPPEAA